MSNLNWTLNCILFGAEVIKLIEQGKRLEAIGKIKNLSSELNDDKIASYLVESLLETLTIKSPTK